jgi:hypothetical protein
VGEHILSLIQHLEDFAASDALAEASTLMTGLERLGEGEWRAVGAALGISEAELVALAKASGGEQGPDAADAAHAGDEAFHFCNAWLAVIARATAGVVVGQALAIPRLSHCGAHQLHMDTTYLVNVLHNLEVQPHPALVLLNQLAGLSAEDMHARLLEPVPTSRTAISPVVQRKIERRYASARGLEAGD